MHQNREPQRLRGPGLQNGQGRRDGHRKKKLTGNGDWPAWRGPHRDGRLAWLPGQLPASPAIVWKKDLTARGLAGIAATKTHVIVVDRDLTDTIDVFRCLDAATGNDRWTLRRPARGDLDYGNSPRATPLFHGDAVYLLGAFGHLHCVELATGKTRWRLDLREEFGAADELKWGVCSSPLIVAGRLIVNPGGPEASLVALDPEKGTVLWKSPGQPAAFGSFLAGEFGGRSQVIGYDKLTLGGWDVETGKRLWTLRPKNANDFNVPTPVRASETLIVSTENNGTRQYRFRPDGTLDPEPLAENLDLAPDTHTPVLVENRLFGVWSGLYCLDVSQKLKTVWLSQDPAFSGYASLVASPDRLLATSSRGELILLDPAANAPMILSRSRIFEDDDGVLSHPAFVGTRMYLRGTSALCCVDLA